jgi:hypothetical protein
MGRQPLQQIIQGKSLGQSNTESQGDNPAEKTRKVSQLVQHREQGRIDSPQVLIDLC